MERLIKHFARLLFVLMYIGGISISISAAEGEDIYDVSTYKNILNIRYSPNSGDSFTGGFSDLGAWTCFTLPSEANWVNGFCGPFELDHRFWIADALLKVGFTPDAATESFLSHETCYNPGELSISAQSQAGSISQSLFYTDKYTALWSCSTPQSLPLYVAGGQLSEVASTSLNGNTFSMSLSSGETLCVTFSPDFRLSFNSSKLMAQLPAGKKGYAAISYFFDKNALASYQQQLLKMVAAPQPAIDAHRARWTAYLKSVLRTDMPAVYNRVAVKSVCTLLSNWRAARGDLLHDGVIPSHAVGYFIGFWGWDSWKHAVALSLFEPQLAMNQVRAMFDYQLSDGMIIDCIYTDKSENNERDSKPPLAAWAVSEIYKATHDIGFVKEMYPKLLKYYRWWYKYRDHDGNGICEFGATDGTLEAAAWESGMDNAIRFDNARMVRNFEGAWSMNQESVDLNAYLVYEWQLLKELAAVAGVEFNEPSHVAGIADYFFDSDKGFFYDKRLSDHSFVRVEGCEAYIPFWAHLASKEQAESALAYFKNPLKFGTYIPFPTVTADHPRFSSNGYWRGPIWLDQVYFGIHGLRNYGYTELADEYTKRVFDRLDGLCTDAPIHENYDTNTGRCLKSSHFSWSAAHLLMMYREAGTLKADTGTLCLFQSSYRNFAYIKSVDFANIHSLSKYSETNWTDFSSQYIANIEPGKDYPLKATVANYDSGSSDSYKLRLWIDWNGNNVLEQNELIDSKLISPIGNSGQEHMCQFSVRAPQDAQLNREIKFRLFLHYAANEADGLNPCGWVDSGTAQDFALCLKPNSGIAPVTAASATKVFPNPVDDILNIVSPVPIKNCSLYALNGAPWAKSFGSTDYISVKSVASGPYVLVVEYDSVRALPSDKFKIVVYK